MPCHASKQISTLQATKALMLCTACGCCLYSLAAIARIETLRLKHAADNKQQQQQCRAAAQCMHLQLCCTITKALQLAMVMFLLTPCGGPCCA